MNILNILLVDNHQIIRDGIKLMLNNEKNVNIVADVVDADTALSILSATAHINMVIADIDLPVEDGIFLLQQVRQQYPSVMFLFLGSVVNEMLAMQAVEHGANGYVPKNVDMKTLLHAITSINKGEIYYHKSVADLIIKKLMNRKLHHELAPDIIGNLTNREKEILLLVAKGLNNVHIAEQLLISVRTVENHRANILRKVNVKNTAELVRFALKHNLLIKNT